MDIIERLTLEAAQADTMIACEHRQRYEFAASLLQGRRVLDLCCGSGYGTRILAAEAAHVVGVDNDIATIETARVAVGESTANVSFEISDADAYLRSDAAAAFDAIVCFEGLEHLPELDEALALLCGHAERGTMVIASVPNDKLSGVRNPFHVTDFGYDDAVRAFAGFPALTMVPQFLAEGALICPADATEAEIKLAMEDRYEPEYANHFIFCAGVDPGQIGRVHHGRMLLSTSPIFNRWSEDLKQGAWALRRENARLARARLGKAGSAAASALHGINERESRYAALEQRYHEAERRVAELEAMVAAGLPPAETAPPLPIMREFDAEQARALDPGDGDPNSWEHRRRRAAEVLIPWIERTVPLAGKTVLEYGCGNGAVSSAFAARAARVIGLDIDTAGIEEGRRRIGELGLDNVELELHPLDAVLAATAAHRGDVDVFLLYAVLEHLTVGERLELLRLARTVVSPGGAIVVCETPNRLIYFDHHTAQMPFFHLLPDELALECYDSSPRAEFRAAVDGAAADGREQALQAIARWGRGVSFHEFEAVFGDGLGQHVLASNYDPMLFGERPVHPEEIVLSRYLNRMRPDLAPVWSRYWLDVILSPEPITRHEPLLTPWSADTSDSTGVAWTSWENLLFTRPGAKLRIMLPQPTMRLVVGSVTLDGHWVELVLSPEDGSSSLLTRHRSPAGRHAFTTFELDAPAQRFMLEASKPCHVVFVGYDV